MRTGPRRKVVLPALGLGEIKELVRSHARTLMDRYGIRVVGVFCSYTRGTQKRKSDIDLLAEINCPISCWNWWGLAEMIDDLEDYYLAADILERIRKGKESTHSATEVRKDLGLVD